MDKESQYKSYLIVVRDKSKISDFEYFGFATYVSPYTPLIGFLCREHVINILETHPNVISIEEDENGSLCEGGRNIVPEHL